MGIAGLSPSFVAGSNYTDRALLRTLRNPQLPSGAIADTPASNSGAAVANPGSLPGTPGNAGANGTQAGKSEAGGNSASSGVAQLTPAQQAQVAKLKDIDRRVRQHEYAHLAASGGLATSGANFSYQRGPDGVNYAVGGEVRIDTSPGRTPQDTIQRARIILAAALAPADPSGQDEAVAVEARQMEYQARAELALQAAREATQAAAAQDRAPSAVANDRSNSEATQAKPLQGPGEPGAAQRVRGATVRQAYGEARANSDVAPDRTAQVNVFA
jgi:hypothetical protein